MTEIQGILDDARFTATDPAPSLIELTDEVINEAYSWGSSDAYADYECR